MALPYIILGHDATVLYHDQLDGELIAYILQAKHLFEGGIIPEFMGGVYKTVLTPPAPAAVLLFKLFSGFTGLVIMQIAGSTVGYLGMYALSKYSTESTPIAVAVGVIYAYLPFLPVYGLSQYGIPMLLFLIINAAQRNNVKNTLAAFVYGIIYALNSSLVLVGFGILGSIALWMIIILIKGCRSKESSSIKTFRSMLIVWIGMLAAYVAENLTLIRQTLGLSDTFVSHKTEYALASDRYFAGFCDAFINGGQHSGDFHKYFMWLLAAELLLCVLPFVRKRFFNEKEIKIYHTLCLCILVNAAYAFVTALWNGDIGIKLRESFGILGTFQLDRLMWIAPCLWYLAFACGLYLLVLACQKKKKSVMAALRGAAAMAVLAVCGINVLLQSNLKPNLQKVVNPSYPVISFSDYYAEDVLAQIKEYIYETTGKNTDEYRVASLGIDPAAALYNGFYCIDGYSNNYSLEYKHAFRKIIAGELDKSDYLRAYFDEWGNRCYLFSSECPGYYMIEKGSFYFQDLSIDAEAFKDMGGDYIISAAYIANADSCGLSLLCQEPFETEDSYYRLYLYGVSETEKIY
jgi:hypothetical protein